LASNFDWRSLVDQLADVERAPQRTLRAQQTKLQQRTAAFASIKTQLETLRAKLTVLKDPKFYDQRTTTTSDSSQATATATTGTAIGTYNFVINSLATAAAMQGTSDIAKPLSATDDVSGLVLSQAGFAGGFKEGTITVNGKQITLAATDTLQAVFDRINTATGGAVSASYSSANDAITLTGAEPVVLGSATDTSNFLQAARLANNGGNSVTSTGRIGAVNLAATLSNSNLSTAISDGAGQGEFKINGVSIQFKATESMSTILTRINDSNAGVIAAYDPNQDRFTLTNRTTGDLGFALEEVTGNFLAATGLSGGTLARGKNLTYSVNGSADLVSTGNTITEASSGISGLKVTALGEGSVTVNVTSDQAGLQKALTEFVTEYNKAQSMISTNVASSTDPKGKVTSGVLAGDMDAVELSGRLRGLLTSTVAGMTGVIRRLEDLGFASNGKDDTLSVSNTDKLSNALTNNLNDIKRLFTDGTGSITATLDSYLERTIGENGTLTKHQATLGTQSSGIDTQVAEMERWVLVRRQQMIDSFVAMETAQQKINQQMAFLAQQFK
jgi:flagellar hook-associated protein 2